MKSIYNALRSNGKLVFCENLVGSSLHSVLRKNFSPSYGTWRYISISELHELTRMFSELKYSTYGYLGVLGRQKIPNQILGFVDKKIDHFIKDENKYIVSCICEK